VLTNDNYSNFRFSKRAGDVLSPLSTKKFGFGTHTLSIHKNSLYPNTEMNSARDNSF